MNKARIFAMPVEQAILQRGSVVSCRFPLAETPREPGPAARPALVVRVFLDKVDHRWKAIVAYGTSKNTRSNTGFEIRIREPETLAQAGLHKPTRFILNRMRILPIDRRFFAFGASQTPILGQLDESLFERLSGLCDRLSQMAPELRQMLGEASANTRGPQSCEEARLDGSLADAYLLHASQGRRRQPRRASQARMA